MSDPEKNEHGYYVVPDRTEARRLTPKGPSYADFLALKAQAEAYAADPTQPDPYQAINSYFSSLRDNQYRHARVGLEALVLVRAIRDGQMSAGRETFSPEYGNSGTIARGLPHSYPLLLTAIGWRLGAMLESAEQMDAEQKAALAQQLTHEVQQYDPYGYDWSRNIGKIERTLLPAPAPAPQPVLPWYKKLLRLGK